MDLFKKEDSLTKKEQGWDGVLDKNSFYQMKNQKIDDPLKEKYTKMGETIDSLRGLGMSDSDIEGEFNTRTQVLYDRGRTTKEINDMLGLSDDSMNQYRESLDKIKMQADAAKARTPFKKYHNRYLSAKKQGIDYETFKKYEDNKSLNAAMKAVLPEAVDEKLDEVGKILGDTQFEPGETPKHFFIESKNKTLGEAYFYARDKTPEEVASAFPSDRKDKIEVLLRYTHPNKLKLADKFLEHDNLSRESYLFTNIWNGDIDKEKEYQALSDFEKEQYYIDNFVKKEFSGNVSIMVNNFNERNAYLKNIKDVIVKSERARVVTQAESWVDKKYSIDMLNSIDSYETAVTMASSIESTERRWNSFDVGVKKWWVSTVQGLYARTLKGVSDLSKTTLKPIDLSTEKRQNDLLFKYPKKIREDIKKAMDFYYGEDSINQDLFDTVLLIGGELAPDIAATLGLNVILQNKAAAKVPVSLLRGLKAGGDMFEEVYNDTGSIEKAIIASAKKMNTTTATNLALQSITAPSDWVWMHEAIKNGYSTNIGRTAVSQLVDRSFGAGLYGGAGALEKIIDDKWIKGKSFEEISFLNELLVGGAFGAIVNGKISSWDKSEEAFKAAQQMRARKIAYRDADKTARYLMRYLANDADLSFEEAQSVSAICSVYLQHREKMLGGIPGSGLGEFRRALAPQVYFKPHEKMAYGALDTIDEITGAIVDPAVTLGRVWNGLKYNFNGSRGMVLDSTADIDPKVLSEFALNVSNAFRNAKTPGDVMKELISLQWKSIAAIDLSSHNTIPRVQKEINTMQRIVFGAKAGSLVDSKNIPSISMDDAMAKITRGWTEYLQTGIAQDVDIAEYYNNLTSLMVDIGKTIKGPGLLEPRMIKKVENVSKVYRPKERVADAIIESESHPMMKYGFIDFSREAFGDDVGDALQTATDKFKETFSHNPFKGLSLGKNWNKVGADNIYPQSIKNFETQVRRGEVSDTVDLLGGTRVAGLVAPALKDKTPEDIQSLHEYNAKLGELIDSGWHIGLHGSRTAVMSQVRDIALEAAGIEGLNKDVVKALNTIARYADREIGELSLFHQEGADNLPFESASADRELASFAKNIDFDDMRFMNAAITIMLSKQLEKTGGFGKNAEWDVEGSIDNVSLYLKLKSREIMDIFADNKAGQVHIGEGLVDFIEESVPIYSKQKITKDLYAREIDHEIADQIDGIFSSFSAMGEVVKAGNATPEAYNTALKNLDESLLILFPNIIGDEETRTLVKAVTIDPNGKISDLPSDTLASLITAFKNIKEVGIRRRKDKLAPMNEYVSEHLSLIKDFIMTEYDMTDTQWRSFLNGESLEKIGNEKLAKLIYSISRERAREGTDGALVPALGTSFKAKLTLITNRIAGLFTGSPSTSLNNNPAYDLLIRGWEKVRTQQQVDMIRLTSELNLIIKRHGFTEDDLTAVYRIIPPKAEGETGMLEKVERYPTAEFFKSKINAVGDTSTPDVYKTLTLEQMIVVYQRMTADPRIIETYEKANSIKREEIATIMKNLPDKAKELANDTLYFYELYADDIAEAADTILNIGFKKKQGIYVPKRTDFNIFNRNQPTAKEVRDWTGFFRLESLQHSTLADNLPVQTEGLRELIVSHLLGRVNFTHAAGYAYVVNELFGQNGILSQGTKLFLVGDEAWFRRHIDSILGQISPEYDDLTQEIIQMVISNSSLSKLLYNPMVFAKQISAIVYVGSEFGTKNVVFAVDFLMKNPSLVNEMFNMALPMQMNSAHAKLLRGFAQESNKIYQQFVEIGTSHIALGDKIVKMISFIAGLRAGLDIELIAEGINRINNTLEKYDSVDKEGWGYAKHVLMFSNMSEKITNMGFVGIPRDLKDGKYVAALNKVVSLIGGAYLIAGISLWGMDKIKDITTREYFEAAMIELITTVPVLGGIVQGLLYMGHRLYSGPPEEILGNAIVVVRTVYRASQGETQDPTEILMVLADAMSVILSLSYGTPTVMGYRLMSVISEKDLKYLLTSKSINSDKRASAILETLSASIRKKEFGMKPQNRTPEELAVLDKELSRRAVIEKGLKNLRDIERFKEEEALKMGIANWDHIKKQKGRLIR